jgi:dienelactone hydrolase
MSSSPPLEPRYFGPDARPLFGLLHGASTPETSLGLLICKPFGYESVCAHRGLVHIADAAAAAGVPALRFDYDGTGDSAGDDRDPGRVAAWIASIGHAIDELRRATGVARVCVLGVRLGALLAATAIEGRDDVAGLVAFAGVASGRAHARELRALHLAIGLPDPPAGVAVDETVHESAGFALTAETREALGKLDATRSTKGTAAHLLLLDRDDLPGNDKWAEHARTQGTAVVQEKVPGYVEMVLDPHKTKPPRAMIARLVPWLRERAKAEPPRRAEPISGTNVARFGDVEDTASFLEGDPRMFSIVSRPLAPPSTTKRGILLLNAGAIHHIGPNRMYVPLARRWASRGHVVIRLDLPGLGDSRVRAGRWENDVYHDPALQEVSAAITLLRREPGVRTVHATGLCSGGYYAFKAALSDPRVDGVIPINQPIWFWREGMSLDVAPAAIASKSKRFASSASDPAKWLKILRGQTDVRPIVRIVARRAVAVAVNRARAVSRRVGIALPNDIPTELEAVVKRGVDLRFVYATDEAGLILLRGEAGPTLDRLVASGGIKLELIEGPDHTFTALWAQDALIDRLGRLLD